MTDAARAARRRILIGSIQEGAQQFDILGFVVWWSVRNVEITQKQFATLLTDVGLSAKWAREHNYRSAFTRALRNMEEKRIIRKVEEDDSRLTFQFTAENKVGVGGDKRLEYDPETILEVDKNIYRKTEKFEDALVKGSPEIKEKVVKFFYEEKTKYNSSDITRYVQNILGEKADIISLRDQGCVYFVPAGYQDVMDKTIALVTALGGGSLMENFPVPNVASSRKMVGKAFLDEIDTMLEKMEVEVTAVENGSKPVSDQWSESRIDKIRNVLDRISNFSEVLQGNDKKRLEDSFAALEKRIMPKRMLDLDSKEEEKTEPKAEKSEKPEPAVKVS